MTTYDVDGSPLYHCTACQDTGFVRGEQGSHGLDCPGNGRCGIGRCGKPGGTFYAHTYTRRCFCRATNPHLAAERAYLNDRRMNLTGAKQTGH